MNSPGEMGCCRACSRGRKLRVKGCFTCVTMPPRSDTKRDGEESQSEGGEWATGMAGAAL